MTTSDCRLVRLPEDLCSAAEHKFHQKFASIEELLTFILQDLMQDSESSDRMEETIVEDRLRELGYI
jgi:hypothetical protein